MVFVTLRRFLQLPMRNRPTIMPKSGCPLFLIICFCFLSNLTVALPLAEAQIPDTLEIERKMNVIDSIFKANGDQERVALEIDMIFKTLADSASHVFFVDHLGQIGINSRRNYLFENAVFWHNQQKKYAGLAAYPIGKVVALNNIGLLYRRMDRYAKSIEAYQLALKISDSLNYLKGYTHATNGLGNIYLLLGNHDEALRNFRECLRVEQKMNSLTGVALNLNNIGHVYLQQDNLEEALEYFMLSLEVNRELSNKRGIAICYNDIGEIYRRRGETEKAMNYFKLSHQLNTSINDLYYLSWNNLKIAEILLLSKKYHDALPYVTQSQQLAEKTNNRSVLKDAYLYLFQINKALGRTQQAIDFLEKATVVNDSILNENTQKIVFRMQATFNREQSDHKIALLENEKQLADLKVKRQQMITIITLFVMFAVVLGMMTVLLFLYYLRKKNNQLKINNIEIEAGRNQLREYANQLLIAKQEAEQGNRLKSQFLANMSHEIRTPMNSVIGFADILSKMIDDPTQLNYLASIRLSGHSLLALINDILDLSKIEAGRSEIMYTTMDFPALLNDVRKVFELQCLEQKNELIIETEVSMPRHLHFAESALRQILINLVGNAVKFTRSGKITVSSRLMDVNENEATLALRVSDTGSGIPAEDVEFIFEAFYQTQTGKSENRGTGLGLTITKRLIQALGGTINVSSSAVSGTEFNFSFPNVQIIPGLQRLKLINRETESIHIVNICLLSCQNLIKAFVDKSLEVAGNDCDVYSDFELFKDNVLRSPYQLYLLDPAFVASTGKNGVQNDEIILWLTSRNAAVATVGTTDDLRFAHEVWPHFILPTQMSQLSSFILKSLDQKIHEKSGTAPAKQFLFQDELSAKTLIDAFLKAEQSHFINHSTDFTSQLEKFALANPIFSLNGFAATLRSAVETFDIEEIEQCLGKFRQMVNVEDFENKT